MYNPAFTLPIFIRVFFVGNRFRAGPWNLGKFSIPIGIVASGFVALMVPILCLPSVTGADLTLETMNWTALVYGGPMILVTIWWFVSAHKWFKGPKVNIQHMMLGREGNVIDGKDNARDSGSDRAAMTGTGDKKDLS